MLNALYTPFYSSKQPCQVKTPFNVHFTDEETKAQSVRNLSTQWHLSEQGFEQSCSIPKLVQKRTLLYSLWELSI